MTTIAYKNGILATDSRMSCNGIIVNERCTKIHKVNDGYVAISGSLADGLVLVSILNDQCDYTNLQDLQVDALLIEIRGKRCTPVALEFTGNHILKLKLDKICAAGSGGLIALGAMYGGSSAVESIKVAAKLDVNTNSYVQYRICK